MSSKSNYAYFNNKERRYAIISLHYYTYYIFIRYTNGETVIISLMNENNISHYTELS